VRVVELAWWALALEDDDDDHVNEARFIQAASGAVQRQRQRRQVRLGTYAMMLKALSACFMAGTTAAPVG